MSEIQFKQQLKSLHKVDPDKVWAELQKVCDLNDGLASPQAIVNRARPKKSPLHPAFEWEDTLAAEAYRRDQARSLVTNFELVFEEGNSLPAMVNVRVNKQRGYMPTEKAMEDSDLRNQVLKQALTQLLGLEKRFKSLSELSGVFQEVHTVARTIGVKENAA